MYPQANNSAFVSSVNNNNNNNNNNISSSNSDNKEQFSHEGNENIQDFAHLSQVNRMFEERSVFITGASGFIGRVLLEKLLRTYKGIKRIYILMRTKKNQSPYERLHKQLLKVPIFDQIRSMGEIGDKLLAKICVIAGDIGEENLGMSEDDMRMMLQDETLSIVFHSAATIKFDEPLKVSVQLNLIATRTILEFCKKLPNLISLCHVSTAYVNSDLKDNQIIEEKIYPISEDPENLIKMANFMDEDLMQLLKVKFVGQRPNTYTYTKALAEHLIVNEAGELPIAIVRPSIVVAAWQEPIKGWIDNLNGPTGLILAIGKGLLRSMLVKRNCKADIIPVDIVVNTMIAAAYYVAKTNNKLSKTCVHNGIMAKSALPLASNGLVNEKIANKKSNSLELKIKVPRIAELKEEEEEEEEEEQSSMMVQENEQNQTNRLMTINNIQNDTTSKIGININTPPIFHCSSGDRNPITWGEMEDLFFPIIKNYPSSQVLRYPMGSFKGNKYHDLIARIFAHYLPALIIDMLCTLMGKKRQLLSVYHKLHCATAALSHFCTTNYNFSTRNLELIQKELNDVDKNELYIDMDGLNWLTFWDHYVLGARRFVLKEEDHTLPKARELFLRAYYIEIALRSLLVLVFSFVCLPIVIRMTSINPFRYAMQTLQAVLA